MNNQLALIDTEPTPPASTAALLTLEELTQFRNQFWQGQVNADQVREMWKRFRASLEQIRADLNRLTIAELRKSYCGPWISSSDKKARVVEDAINRFRDLFDPREFQTHGYGQDLWDIVEEATAQWTDELIQNNAAKRRAAIESHVKALTNPETLDEFRQFIARRGINKLNPEQLARYDELQAGEGKRYRQWQQECKADARSVEVPEELTFTIVPTTHTRDGHDIWVVQISQRVEKPVYEKLNARAKKLGGYYSSYAKNGAIPGFTFTSEEAAQQFASNEFVDGSERAAERLEDKRQRAARRILEQAATLREETETQLGQERKENTARRVAIAASIEIRNLRAQQLAETMEQVAEAIQGHEVQFIDRLGTRAHFEQLESMLSQASGAAMRASSKPWDSYREATSEDIPYTLFPYPCIHRESLANLISELESKSGFKLVMGRMQKRLAQAQKAYPNRWLVEFRDDQSIEDLRKVAERLKKYSSNRINAYQREILLGAMDAYDRLHRMDIRTPEELRAALREYLQYRGPQAQANPLKKLLRSLVSIRIPDFHPTPHKVGLRMVDLLDPKPGERICEPSAGKGDLVDVLGQRISLNAISLTLYETNLDLVEILTVKSYPAEIVRQDFTESSGTFDKFIANPPFSNKQDIYHVRHMHQLMAPGGRIVSVMGESAFTNSDRVATDFQHWFRAVGGQDERLPSGSFEESDRPTGVATRLIVIDKK